MLIVFMLDGNYDTESFLDDLDFLGGESGYFNFVLNIPVLIS